MIKLGRWLAMAVAVGALAAQAGTAAAGSLRTGFLDPAASGGGSIPGFPIDNAVASKKVASSGASIVRLYAFWNRIETNEGHFNWNDLDDQIEAAVAQDLDVMLTLRSAPHWAEGSCSNVLREGTCKPDVQAFHDFAFAAANHYKAPQFGNHVRYWGIWNEPNNPFFLVPQYKTKNGVRHMVSAGRYRALLNAGAEAVRSVSQKNLVVGGDTAPFGHPKSPAPLAFLRKVLCVTNSGKKTCDAPKVKADIWATHPYTSGDPRHHAFGKDDVSFGDLGQWKKLVKGAARSRRFVNGDGDSRIRLWNTEFSWDTKPPDDEGVPTRLHARWTAEALYRTWKCGIEALFWLQLRDYPVGHTYQSGLYRYQNSTTQVSKPKLSLKAFHFPFVAYANHSRIKVWGRTPDSHPHTVRIERKTSSGWRLVKKASASGNGIFTKSWSSGDTDGKYRARLANTSMSSVGFSLHRPPDRFVKPFGGP